MRFKLGEIYTTRGIMHALNDGSLTQDFLMTCLDRYVEGDWGDMDEEDKLSNNQAVEEDTRIFAAYELSETNTKIWIITEWDRSYTTVMFPSEY